MHKRNPSAFVRSTKTMLLAVLLVTAGCSRGLDTSYGPSSGFSGSRSLNGFGALRETFSSAGYQDRDLRRLSERMKRSRVIVWTPQTPAGIERKVTQWFENWFRTGSKTLVFIVPDSGSETEYWHNAAKIAPAKQRLEYRRRVAERKNLRMKWAMNRGTIASNGWFTAVPKLQVSKRSKLDSSEWDLASEDPAIADQQILTEYILLGKNEAKAAVAAMKVKGAAAALVPGMGPNGPTGPSAPFTMPTTVTESHTTVNFRPLLKTEAGDTVIAGVTSKRWNRSRVIVVAGGSLLTNYSFIHELNRDLANHVVKHCEGDFDIKPPATRDSPMAGFLTNSYLPISVSEKKDGVAKATGVELLTVYPLSLVTIHGVLLGFIACMIFLPIFGRSRRLKRVSNRRFGDHLDAVASLMTRSRGEKYARNRISQYMRRMKGETEGKWVLPEPVKKSPLNKLVVAPVAAAAAGKLTQQPSVSPLPAPLPPNSAQFSSDADPNDGQPNDGQPSEGQPNEGQPSEGQPSEGPSSDGPPAGGATG